MDNNHDSEARYSIYISELIHRLREGLPLTEVEGGDLEEWRKPAGREEVFQDLMDRRRFVASVKEMKGYDAEAAVAEVLEQLGLRASQETGWGRRVGWGRMVGWGRWAAAAVVLLAVVAVWVLKPGRKVEVPAAPAVVVAADGNKATLTLANGKTVMLDTVKNGVVINQGGSKAVKMGDGRLGYQPGGSAAVEYNTLTTPRGGQYQLTLPDGSRVWLNAASAITYPTVFVGNERLVKVSGEAYIEVVRDAGKPLRVEAGGQRVEVLGTSFNINAYADEPAMRTTLVEGKIRVNSGAVAKVLAPGQQAVGAGLEVLSGVDMDEVLAWKNGAFSFRGADIQTVMRQLARWYDIDVEYPEGVPAGTFDGEIGRGLTLNQVLEGLAKARIKYTIATAHKIIIRP